MTNCHQLKLLAEDGKLRKTDCANTKTIFRIIQSIPSPKAEPFKQWLAQVGYERVDEYKNHKGLKRENLRDHMTDLELIFNMLGEASTTEIARKKNSLGFQENKSAARKGGKIAGDARKKLELETGKSIVSPENYLAEPEKNKRKRLTAK